MNDPLRPDDLPMASPDDEAVSAVLDDEATADERARVDADPDLRGQLDAFTRVRDANAAVDAPSAELRRALVATAMNTADADDQPNPTADDGRASVVDLDRERRRRRLATVLAVAAVLVVVVPLLAVTILSGGRETSFDTATMSDDSSSEDARTGDSESADDPLASGVERDSEPTEAPAAGPGFALAELGAVDSLAELRATVLRSLAALQARALDATNDPGPTSTTTAPPVAAAESFRMAAPTCAAAIGAADLSLGTLVWSGAATLAGDAVAVFVFGAGNGTMVVARPDCTIVDRQSL